MPLNLASPGIVVREVDLTTGRIDPTSDKIGAIVAPFAKGPIDVPVLINNEQELLSNFGEPYPVDKHYESWLTASSFLAYGGSLRVVRNDDDNLTNAFVGSGSTDRVKIKSYEDYVNLGYDENSISGVTFAARNPGSWANGIKVAIIDSKSDQILSGITTTAVTNFVATINDRSGVLAGSGTTIGIVTTGPNIQIGQEVRCDINGIIATGTTVTGISTLGFITISNASLSSAPVTTTFDFGSTTTISTTLAVGMGVTQSISSILPGAGTTSNVLNGYLKGVITDIGKNSISVKLVSHVSESAVETPVDYQEGGIYAFANTGNVAIHTSGGLLGSSSYTTRQDWFSQQSISLTNSSLSWNNIANRPGTSAYASARGGRFDEIHVVVIDDNGSITGNAGTILEKHLDLSKASDAEYSAGSPSYWRKYISENSQYIFAGGAPTGITTVSFVSGFTLSSDTGWDKQALSHNFAGYGVSTFTLQSGKNYNGQANISNTGALQPSLSNLSTGYDLFQNNEEYKVDFLLMGSCGYSQDVAQALASKLISIAELRKDAIAFISPYRSGLLTETGSSQYTLKDASDITDNLISYYASIPSSSYAIFDSGYKYMYDRFSQTFRYVPLNGDIAGLCARNDANNFPWFSPAGTVRGSILNAVKLAFNPSKAQRDRLYSARINPVIFSPGSGIILFGDKTALAKSSAFDRINVRRLFIYLENAVSAAAKDVMFEFNDTLTRSGFVNTVEPFLRDVQAKRGILDFRVICDETNNTASVIDGNEFVADIYIKPNKSINFIGLTFVATKTGVSFEEVIGNV